MIGTLEEEEADELDVVLDDEDGFGVGFGGVGAFDDVFAAGADDVDVESCEIEIGIGSTLTVPP